MANRNPSTSRLGIMEQAALITQTRFACTVEAGANANGGYGM
jgi:hypothetical protein